ncbi:MAG: hypothetical protein AAB875_07120 [Patescibacteria group bacterium]
MTELEIRNKTIEEVRAFIASRFLSYVDIREPSGCDTCDNTKDGLSMEAISEVLDKLKERRPAWQMGLQSR